MTPPPPDTSATPPASSDPKAALHTLLDALNSSSVEEAAELIRVMKKYVLRHFRNRKKLESLGFDGLDDALQALRTAKQTVRRVREENEQILDAYRAGNLDVEAQGLHDLFEQLYAEIRDIHRLLGVDTNADALATIRQMADRLDRARRAEDMLQELQDVLDIDDSPAETVDAVESITQQLEALYDEKETLSEVGLTSADEAVDMIQSMQDQLDQMYDEKHATIEDADVDGLDEDADTYEQIESLLAREDLLTRELGVSDPQDVVDMVHHLEDQLSDVLRHGPGPLPDDVDAQDLLDIEDVGDRIEALADERDALADEIDTLSSENRSLAQRLDALKQRMAQIEDELGTANPGALSAMVQALSRQLAAADGAPKDAPASLPSASPPALDNDDSLIDDADLARLETMTADDLDALDVGAVAVDDDGVIRFVSAASPRLPGLTDDATGTPFFEAVPGTRTALFEGRFREGIRRGEIDERFAYTFVPAGPSDDATPLPARVHLHRKPGEAITWILYDARPPDRLTAGRSDPDAPSDPVDG